LTLRISSFATETPSLASETCIPHRGFLRGKVYLLVP
jgi:hypothetical protein